MKKLRRSKLDCKIKKGKDKIKKKKRMSRQLKLRQFLRMIESYQEVSR